MWPPMDANYEGISIDEPLAKPTPPQEAQQAWVPGVYKICYLCAKPSSTIPKGQAFVIKYTKPAADPKKWPPEALEEYVITYCYSCYVSLQYMCSRNT